MIVHTRDLRISDRVRFVFPEDLAGREATVIERPGRFQGNNMAAVVVRLDDDDTDDALKLVAGWALERP